MNDHREPRDPALDALLGEHSAETPPAHVDAAILAAAHRAVRGGPRPARATQAWRRWIPLAAAAVVGVIVVGVLPLAPSIVEESAPVSTDVPANAPARPRPDTPASAAAPAQKAAAAVEPRAAPAARPAEVPRSAAARERGNAAPPSTTSVDAASDQAPMPLGATPQRAASADARDDLDARPHSAEDWIARMRALRSRGDVREATRALAEFRAAFGDADARLPADLREWARALH